MVLPLPKKTVIHSPHTHTHTHARCLQRTENERATERISKWSGEWDRWRGHRRRKDRLQCSTMCAKSEQEHGRGKLQLCLRLLSPLDIKRVVHLCLLIVSRSPPTIEFTWAHDVCISSWLYLRALIDGRAVARDGRSILSYFAVSFWFSVRARTRPWLTHTQAIEWNFSAWEKSSAANCHSMQQLHSNRNECRIQCKRTE